jgi:uncharacterized protein YjeT (DUF2065 family)
MRWTRVSFIYLIGYLAVGGVGILLAPDFGLRLLGATGSYPSSLVRLLGAFVLALAVIVIQIARHRVEVLYPTTLLVRLVLVSATVGIYLETRDPLFLALTAIIAFGMTLTVAGMLVDRRRLP